jgi:DNA-binding transcriptional LysR family regulator
MGLSTYNFACCYAEGMVETLRFAEALVACSEADTLTEAAEHLGCSQPTLSRRLDALELFSGRPLVARSRGGTQLTVEGERLSALARVLLAQAGAFSDELRPPPANSSCVRLALTARCVPTLVDSMLAGFPTRDSLIEVVVSSQCPGSARSALLDRDVDVVIGTVPKSDGLVRIDLMDEPLVAMLSIDHPLAQFVILTVNDLDDYGFVVSPWLDDEQFDRWVAALGLKQADRTSYAEDITSLQGQLTRGNQAHLCPISVAAYFGHPRIVTIRLEPELRVMLSLTHRANPSPEVLQFVSHAWNSRPTRRTKDTRASSQVPAAAVVG